MLGTLSRLHGFRLRELSLWAQTDVDTIFFMDDSSGQRPLLMPPTVWRDPFRLLYCDYCQMAHAHGKFIYMHSDRFIEKISDNLIDTDLDTINSQLFCMYMAALSRPCKRSIAFPG